MRTFKKPNISNGWLCPICKKDTDSEVVLVSKYGTAVGNIVEAEQFHLICINLWWYPESNLLAMKYEVDDE